MRKLHSNPEQKLELKEADSGLAKSRAQGAERPHEEDGIVRSPGVSESDSLDAGGNTTSDGSGCTAGHEKSGTLDSDVVEATVENLDDVQSQPNTPLASEVDEGKNTLRPIPKKESKKTGKDTPATSNKDRPKTAKTKTDLLAEVVSSPEFLGDLKHVADLLAQEKNSGLEVGRIAQKWIGDKRYNRILNADKFAQEYSKVTGHKRSGRQIRNYVRAFGVNQLLITSGVDSHDLDVSHLQQIADAHCESDEETVALAKRVIEAKVPLRKIKPLAQQLHADRRQAQRTVNVVTTETKVRVMEALDLLREQADGSIECAILDWQWSPATWGRNTDYPEVHTPNDPVDHVCQCLDILKAKLAEVGSVFLFYRAVGFLDPRIQETCDRLGLKHAGKIIWQKTCGGFQDANTALRVGHEEIHILCHQDYVPKAVNGGVNSVTPKWAAPTHATSAQSAVHRHQKPVALMEYLIRIATMNGLVADPFSGSGSAGIAAVRLGCPYVGSELKPEIAEIANQRIGFARGENEEIVEAVNFFFEGASEKDQAIISTALAKCHLACTQTIIRREAA